MEYEKIIEELDKIIERLEGDKLSLDESIKLYERGTELLKQANTALGNAKGKLTILSKIFDTYEEKPLVLDNDE